MLILALKRGMGYKRGNGISVITMGNWRANGRRKRATIQPHMMNLFKQPCDRTQNWLSIRAVGSLSKNGGES